MSLCVIELNDCEVRVASGSKILVRSPGYAVVLDDVLHLGPQAVTLAHLHPRQTFNRYWANLTQDELPAPGRRFRHHADLAFAHLTALHEQAGKPAQVMFAVPGSFVTEQLSLLLGIAQACPFKVTGLVDNAVAGAAAVVGPGRYLHVDIHLHQTVLTRLDVDTQVARESVETIDNGGLIAIYDAGAELIADTFIQHCRFDPLHHAETEQALYDQIPRCLHALAGRQEVHLEIKFQHTRHQAKLGRDALLARFERNYVNVIQRLETGRTILLGDRLAALPGFADRIAGSSVLDADAVFRGCQEHRVVIEGPGPNLSFVTRLPAPSRPTVIAAPLRPASEAQTEARAAPERPATHLLLGHQAFPLTESPLYLSARGSVSDTRHESSVCAVALNSSRAHITPLGEITMFVNGDRLTGPRPLAAGDRLSFAGSETVYMLISVADPDAA